MRLREAITMRIVVLVAENPKRPNTLAYRAFKELRTGMAVGEYLALEGHRASLDAHPGWATRELRWGLKKNYIRLEPSTSAAPPPMPAAAPEPLT